MCRKQARDDLDWFAPVLSRGAHKRSDLHKARISSRTCFLERVDGIKKNNCNQVVIVTCEEMENVCCCGDAS
jgi:hypothetical protein